MANRLKDASSPYLRQHADNPVDWYEWGDEAFALATAEQRPIFLSVGYSACHWCHVMAHESFEDDGVAAILNTDFVPIKVDREERPDVDAVYMDAVQALVGRGGWPMSVFLTPDRVPFYGGTYWPKEARGGLPGFTDILMAVTDAWTNRRADVNDSGTRLTEHLRKAQAEFDVGGTVDTATADTAAQLCVMAWDRKLGGFGRAPKFPQAMTIDFLLAHFVRTGDVPAREAAIHSLTTMSRGGIYDHVGGGFARYATDAAWLVPHFEKMLYDNALLLRAYVHGWQVTGEPRFARVATETADYLLAEMRHEGGGFYSATDADSEGEEGRFFVWSAAEFDQVVTAAGEDAPTWRRFFGVTEAGNWEHTNILTEAEVRDPADSDFAARLATVRAALYERRGQRVHPGLDDKILSSWNGLALGALAEAGATLDRQDFIAAAGACAAFLRDTMVVNGALRHTWRAGHGATIPAFLEDVSFLAQGLIHLYEADFDPAWLDWAIALAAHAEQHFADGETGTYFATAHDAEELLTRPKDAWDNATPAGASVLVDVHLRLGAFTADPTHAELAQRTLAAFQSRAKQSPTAYGQMLRGLEWHAAGSREVAIIGAPEDGATAALLSTYRQAWRLGTVIAAGEPGDKPAVALLADRGVVDGKAAAYVCRDFVCDRPVTDPAALATALDGARKA